MKHVFLGALCVIATASCHHAMPPASASSAARPTLGSIERLDSALDTLIAPETKIEKLAEGFKWSEGPFWSAADGGGLLFADVPRNRIMRWTEARGITTWLEPSGYTGTAPRGGEPGSNGMLLDPEGRAILCQHGDRRIARLEKDGTFTTLADRFEGKRFNSPNDITRRSNGDLYFTDPPYGLVGHENDPGKELPTSGVFRVTPAGEVTRLFDDLRYPNGIALSPDERTLYVSDSDPERAIWMAFDVKDDGGVTNGRVFFDATPMVKAGRKGLPDGMKVDARGNLFASGPGGILVLSPAGKHLGTLVTGEPTSNCAWGDDGGTLYMTANDKLTRIRTLTRGIAGR